MPDIGENKNDVFRLGCDILTVVVPQMVLQVVLVFRHEDTFWAEEQFLGFDVTYTNYV